MFNWFKNEEPKAKFGSLGWVGAGLFVGEFIQCYWGDNSVFDRTEAR